MAHHREIVRDEEQVRPQALLQLHEQVHHLGLDRDVERRDRLVADRSGRLQRERAGDADALALAAGEFVRVAIRHVGSQADQRDQRGDALAIAPGAGQAWISSGSPMMSRTLMRGFSEP